MQPTVVSLVLWVAFLFLGSVTSPALLGLPSTPPPFHLAYVLQDSFLRALPVMGGMEQPCEFSLLINLVLLCVCQLYWMGLRVARWPNENMGHPQLLR